jgi:hypothetical protein
MCVLCSFLLASIHPFILFKIRIMENSTGRLERRREKVHQSHCECDAYIKILKYFSQHSETTPVTEKIVEEAENTPVVASSEEEQKKESVPAPEAAVEEAEAVVEKSETAEEPVENGNGEAEAPAAEVVPEVGE